MLPKNLLIAFAGGLVAVAIVVVLVFHTQKGAHVELVGKVLKVRTIGLDDGASIAVVDFRVENPADYKFMTHEVSVTLVDAHGNETTGATVSEIDAKRLFEGLPLLGPKYNASLAMNDVVAPHTSVDRMVAARFEVPVSTFANRRNVIVHIDEVDGRANMELKER